MLVFDIMIITKDLHICVLLMLLVCVTGKLVVPQKVAILGDGTASCAAALALTGQPGWKERYNITIYQLGWRLEGKAASGRNKIYAQRVEEIAGHVLPGIYHNTKRLLRSVNRTEGVPFRTFEDAFKLKSYFSQENLQMSLDEEQRCFSLNYLYEKLIKTTYWMVAMATKEMPNASVSADEFDNSHFQLSDFNYIQNWIQEISFEEEN